jgi:hypothetical protein
MTPILPIQVVHAQSRASLRLLLLGMLLGVVFGVLAAVAVSFYAAPVEVVDLKLEKACRYPTREGEVTVIAVHNDRMLCWRMY